MEIPATKPMPVLVKQDAEQNDDEEEADEDDGYEVEEIIAHEKKGKNVSKHVQTVRCVD